MKKGREIHRPFFLDDAFKRQRLASQTFQINYIGGTSKAEHE